MITRIAHYLKKQIAQRKRREVKIGKDCRIIKTPDWGSEPYLIEIGNHVTISFGVTFLTHDGGTWVFRDKPQYKNVVKFGKVIIKDNCFIGCRSILMPGIVIGENSVVAAGSIVTKDVPPNSVVAGVPAKVIMTTEEYAEKCLLKTPQYDRENFIKNKKDEVIRMLGKGDS